MSKLVAWVRYRIDNCTWSDRSKTVLAIGIGLAVGSFGSWLANRPEKPWLAISAVSASYVPGSTSIKIIGTYDAHDVCPRRSAVGPDPLVWRQEVEGSGPEIASYAPRPAPPKLELGEHRFQLELPLTEGISPDGWHVSLLVTCANLELAVRSGPVPVVFIGDYPFAPNRTVE